MLLKLILTVSLSNSFVSLSWQLCKVIPKVLLGRYLGVDRWNNTKIGQKYQHGNINNSTKVMGQFSPRFSVAWAWMKWNHSRRASCEQTFLVLRMSGTITSFKSAYSQNISYFWNNGYDEDKCWYIKDQVFKFSSILTK